eukprot:TRINITY_DN10661_c0_g2_i1.p1 TRINITY_DN10661_c0_g2~~TRINITY_DN10661_c0_g2_i1.p1  ORF type:complete len:366 (-),score=80.65 TRINITY_DN10661_c0_g2_i1:39-1136(-)
MRSSLEDTLKTCGPASVLPRILRNISSNKNSWSYSKMHVGTNYITKATNNFTEDDYVVKVYSKSSGVNHELEHAVIDNLSDKGLHPAVYFFDQNYRVEEFIANSSVDSAQLGNFSKPMRVVKLIAILHSNSNLKSEVTPLADSEQPFVHMVEDSWLSHFHKLYPTIRKTLNDTKYEGFGASLSYMLSEEFHALLQSLTPKKREVVLSHNDISASNIMDTNDNMYLIDYEYCQLNYRGYDLAVLMEDISTDYSYSAYPHFKMHRELAFTEKEEEKLLRHYIVYSGLAVSKGEVNAELLKLRKEVRSLRVLFQLAGVLWGLANHDWNRESFNENDCWKIEYAKQRWEIFIYYIEKNPYEINALNKHN